MQKRTQQKHKLGAHSLAANSSANVLLYNNSFTVLARALCQNHYPSVITEKRYRRGSE